MRIAIASERTAEYNSREQRIHYMRIASDSREQPNSASVQFKFTVIFCFLQFYMIFSILP